jgi:lactoylglutathione lyase
MGIIQGIFETHLEVKNLKKSMDFYEKVLGLKLGRYEEGRRRAFYLIEKEPISMISIVEKKDPDLRHMAFRVNYEDINQMIPFLNNQGVDILPGWNKANPNEPLVYPWLGSASVFFNDIDGNRLEFLTMLPEGPRDDLDVIWMTLSEWNELHSNSL